MPSLLAQVRSVQVDPCQADVGLTCNADLLNYIGRVFFGGEGGGGAVSLAFFGIVFAMFVFYGFQLAISSRNESALTDAFQSYAQALLGIIIFTGSFVLANSFATTEAIVDAENLNANFLSRGIAFLIQIVGLVIIANIFLQGFRMIVSLSECGIETARKNLIQSLVGGGIVMLAVPILEAIIPGAFNTAINDEIVGVANFLVTIFIVLAVLMFIGAGIALVISVDESLKDRARNMIFTSLITIVVVVAAKALLTILLPT